MLQHHFVDIDHQVKFRLARFSCKNLQRHLQVCPASMTLAQSSASKPSCVLDNPKIRINAFTSKFLHKEPNNNERHTLCPSFRTALSDTLNHYLKIYISETELA